MMPSWWYKLQIQTTDKTGTPARCPVCREVLTLCQGHAKTMQEATKPRRTCWWCNYANQVIDEPCGRCGRLV